MPRPLILLTNDDGIYAQGILAAWQELRKIGEVEVVAPDAERSAVGHAITLLLPLRTKEVVRRNTRFGYAVNGMPADCVKIAVKAILPRPPDLVVSGINLGANTGTNVIYSGTVSAATEARILGIPSIAVSLATFTHPDFSYAARFTRKLATASPGWRYSGGFRPLPTPCGVPVEMQSPGSSVIPAERSATIRATEKIMSLVLLSCLATPFTDSRSRSRCGSGTSSAVMITGPIGQLPSRLFPLNHCEVRNCNSRAEMSLTTV